ncbi:MAG: hypothetical protein LBQ96_06540, partial [Fusobacteriaceae bacterium]|nr:hypothetical protein [Fusobacteriaceae bacterium]
LETRPFLVFESIHFMKRKLFCIVFFGSNVKVLFCCLKGMPAFAKKKKKRGKTKKRKVCGIFPETVLYYP